MQTGNRERSHRSRALHDSTRICSVERSFINITLAEISGKEVHMLAIRRPSRGTRPPVQFVADRFARSAVAPNDPDVSILGNAIEGGGLASRRKVCDGVAVRGPSWRKGNADGI